MVNLKIKNLKIKNLKFKKILKKKFIKIIPKKPKKKVDKLAKYIGYLDKEQQILFKNLYKRKLNQFAIEKKQLILNQMLLIPLKIKKTKRLLHVYNLNSNLYYLIRYIPNFILFNKLSNLLMYEGKKEKAEGILLNFFEILLLQYNIKNALDLFRVFIYVNLVPIIRSKTIGFKSKKVIGVPLSIYHRLNMTLKIFIQGARSHNISIAQGLVIEFLNLISNKSILNQYNEKQLDEIKVHSLHKYLKATIVDLNADKDKIKKKDVSKK